MWFFTDRVEALYDAFTRRHIAEITAAGTASTDEFQIRFDEHLYTPFYGRRQFSVRDINGLSLISWQPD